MPAANPRVTAVIDEELDAWLRSRSEAEGRSVSVLVRDILTRRYEEDEERHWARVGEERLESFDRDEAIPHDDVWK